MTKQQKELLINLILLFLGYFIGITINSPINNKPAQETLTPSVTSQSIIMQNNFGTLKIEQNKKYAVIIRELTTSENNDHYKD